MSNKTAKPLVPKLRFPEFRDAVEWAEYSLEEISTRITDKVGDVSLMPVSITAGQGFVSQAEKFGRDIAGQQYKNYVVLSKGEFAYNKGNSKKYPQGCIYKLKEYEQVAAPSAFICFRLSEEHVPDFYQGYFDANYHGAQLQRFISSGARSDGLLNVSPEDFFTIKFISPKKEEQQKIADCLYSIDELIAAQTKKVAALKAHKKGLMQQLFPRDGETVPKLRFSEFLDAGEWEEVALGEIADIKLGKMLDSKKHTDGNLLPYLNNLSVRWNAVDTSNLPKMYFEDDELDRFGLRAGDVVVCEGGEPGRSAVWDGRLPGIKFQKAIHRVRFNIPFEPHLLVFYLESIAGTPKLESLFTGGGIKHLTQEVFAQLKIPITSHAEQQKIADCLASIDELIAAQAQKVEALKAHKKGLMQQLFPALDEVRG